VLVGCYLWQFSNDLVTNVVQEPVASDWFGRGVRYVGYNMASIPLILFCVRHMTSRRDAFAAGLLAGPLVMIPALLFFLAMAATYPEILNAAVPADVMMQRLGIQWLEIIFYIVVFGTFVETGTAFIHAVNERVDEVFHEKNRSMPDWLRLVIALSALLVAVLLALRFGIIDLIARGYGTLTWVIIAVFALPLCTIGVWKILRRRSD
jgi:uncharacterized membrane protein YkvI